MLFIVHCHLLWVLSCSNLRTLSTDDYGGVALAEESVLPLFDTDCVVSVAAPDGSGYGVGIKFTGLRLVNDPPSNTVAFVQVLDGNSVLAQSHPDSSDLKVGIMLKSSSTAGKLVNQSPVAMD